MTAVDCSRCRAAARLNARPDQMLLGTKYICSTHGRSAPALSAEEYAEVERFGLHESEADAHVRSMRRRIGFIAGSVLAVVAVLVGVVMVALFLGQFV